MSTTSGLARVGWGSSLGTLMRLKVTVTPNAAGPLADMTSVITAELRVQHQDSSISTWSLAILGVSTATSITFVHVYGPTDLQKPERLRCTVLMTTAGGIVPSEPFTIQVLN